jgi:hypothetical protein
VIVILSSGCSVSPLDWAFFLEGQRIWATSWMTRRTGRFMRRT